VEVEAVSYYLIADPVAPRSVESPSAVAKDANTLVFTPDEASQALPSPDGLREWLTAGPLRAK
jgi:hypothetical protein